MRTGVKRADAAVAVARARAEIARRGLSGTVTKAYYGLIVAQRKYATAQQALDQAQRSLQISQDLERGREVAHSDVVKSQLQYTAQEQAFRESKLAMESARLDLAVLLFRDFDENFSIVDDLDVAPALPPLPDVEAMAGRANPLLAQAMATLRGTDLDIAIARQAFLPSISLDPVYGIEANAFALHSAVAANKELGPLPNLGYFVTVSLNMPLWDWGVRRSKVKQAELKREQANLELSAAQRTLLRNLRGYFEEAQTAREQVALLRQTVDLASESLRLNTLRYQAGEATILELVDAQTTLTQARNAYDDGLVRYRVALGKSYRHSRGRFSHVEQDIAHRCSSCSVIRLREEGGGRSRGARARSGHRGDAEYHSPHYRRGWNAVPSGSGQRDAENRRAGAEVLREPRRSRETGPASGRAGKSRSGGGRSREQRQRGSSRVQFPRYPRRDGSRSGGEGANRFGCRPRGSGRRQESGGQPSAVV